MVHRVFSFYYIDKSVFQQTTVKRGEWRIDILTGEDLDNMPLESRMLWSIFHSVFLFCTLCYLGGCNRVVCYNNKSLTLPCRIHLTTTWAVCLAPMRFFTSAKRKPKLKSSRCLERTTKIAGLDVSLHEMLSISMVKPHSAHLATLVTVLESCEWRNICLWVKWVQIEVWCHFPGFCLYGSNRGDCN